MRKRKKTDLQRLIELSGGTEGAAKLLDISQRTVQLWVLDEKKIKTMALVAIRALVVQLEEKIAEGRPRKTARKEKP